MPPFSPSLAIYPILFAPRRFLQKRERGDGDVADELDAGAIAEASFFVLPIVPVAAGSAALN